MLEHRTVPDGTKTKYNQKQPCYFKINLNNKNFLYLNQFDPHTYNIHVLINLRLYGLYYYLIKSKQDYI